MFAVLGKAGQKRRLFDIFDKGIFRSTLLVICNRLTDKKVALSVCHCRAQVCNRQCRTIHEINAMGCREGFLPQSWIAVFS